MITSTATKTKRVVSSLRTLKRISLIGNFVRQSNTGCRCFSFTSRVSKMSIKLFQDQEHAGSYVKYRPTYPDSLYSTIVDYYETGKGDTCDFDLAVDIGCGSGQSTRALCSYFRRVIGSDVSEQQIAMAPKDVDNLNFRVGPAEKLDFLENNSVDLLTVAQALHWFKRDDFYEEVKRVVKEGGVFVAYGYGNLVLDNEDAQQHIKKFYRGLLGSYWHPVRRHVDQMYSEIDHPFLGWTRIVDESLSIKRRMPLDAFIGYLSSWSAWRTYLKEHPGSPALDELRQTLLTIYKEKHEDGVPTLSVNWPTFMLIGRKSSS